jgi:membrane protein implicated in regulation of membrane protease activity
MKTFLATLAAGFLLVVAGWEWDLAFVIGLLLFFAGWMFGAEWAFDMGREIDRHEDRNQSVGH